jgi:hypothetical protein
MRMLATNAMHELNAVRTLWEIRILVEIRRWPHWA